MAKDTVTKEESRTDSNGSAKKGAEEGPRPTHVPCPLCGRPSGQTHKRNSQRFFKCEGFDHDPGCGWTFKVNSEDYHDHCHAVETGKRKWEKDEMGRYRLQTAKES